MYLPSRHRRARVRHPRHIWCRLRHLRHIPTRFVGQAASGPSGIGARIVKRHLHHRLVRAGFNCVFGRAFWAFGGAPIGTGHKMPPAWVFQRRGAKHHTTRLFKAGLGAFGIRNIAGRLNEFRKFGIGHFRRVNVKGRNFNSARRAFFAIGRVRSHGEATGGQLDFARYCLACSLTLGLFLSLFLRGFFFALARGQQNGSQPKRGTCAQASWNMRRSNMPAVMRPD